MLHYSIACRTLVAAARGKQLTQLEPPFDWISEPFEIRSLLPAWIGADIWGFKLGASASLQAVRGLRAGLCHASMWLPYCGMGTGAHGKAAHSVSSADGFNGVLMFGLLEESCEEEWLLQSKFNAGSKDRGCRLLSGRDVLALRSHFKAAALIHPDNRDLFEHRALNPFLRCIEQDLALARQVADAWNSVVRRGGADILGCECSKCSAEIHKRRCRRFGSTY